MKSDESQLPQFRNNLKHAKILTDRSVEDNWGKQWRIYITKQGKFHDKNTIPYIRYENN